MKLRLSDIYELQMGKTPARNTPAFWNGTNAWVSISDLTSSRKYISQTRECITDNAITRTGIKKIPKDTLLMSFKLSLGKVAITTTDIYTNEAIMAFIDKKKYDVDVHYMYHYFQAIDWTIGTNKAVKGITLNKRALSEKVVDLPPINIQQEIAERMDNLNAVTENLQRQFMLLDELVKSQFIELFGDPVTNPKGWKTSLVRDTSELISDGPFGSNLKSSHYVPEGIRVIRLGNIGSGKFLDEDKAYISEEHYATLKKYTCHAGEIVIGTLGEPNLRACLIPDDIAVSINKSDCVHFIPKTELLNNIYACAYLNTEGTLQLAQGSLHGQTRSRIAMSQVAALPIMLPPLTLQNKFAAFVEQIDKSKLVLRQLLEKQKTLKAALMQEYFS